MDDAAVGIDEEYASAQSIQRIGKGCRFGFCAIQCLTNEQCAACMRCNEGDTPTHVVIDHARLCRDNGKENRTMRSRFFEHNVCKVGPALRTQPFLIEAPLAIVIVGHKVWN